MSKGTDTVSFLYDAEGKRISKSDGTNTFEYFYADGKLTRIKRNNTTLHFDYDMLGPSVIRYNGVDYYYHRNAQGDIDGISNAAGELVASYRYDAWGKPISVTGTMASTIGVLNPFRYRGYVYDQETGLYYLNSRYYDPEVGRFISPDSVSYLGADGTILGYDLYTYCDNDPVNHKDSGGNLLGEIVGAIVSGAIIGGIVGGVSAALHGENIWAGAAQGVVSGAIATVGVLTGSLTCTFVAGAAGSIVGDLVYSAATMTEYNTPKSLGKAFMAGAFNIFSFGSPEIVKRFAANMSRIGKKAFEFFFSVGMDFYNDVVDRAIDSIGETTGVSIGRAPNVPVFNGHSGGGKLVMARV
ncbi:MAG: RHS repeat-associated core domain-containing protein [Erysipelotrichales bacterium]|nr:RHS repeat-associated core domain-containing protein [Erysipelotrichales bacterium]